MGGNDKDKATQGEGEKISDGHRAFGIVAGILAGAFFGAIAAAVGIMATEMLGHPGIAPSPYVGGVLGAIVGGILGMIFPQKVGRFFAGML